MDVTEIHSRSLLAMALDGMGGMEDSKQVREGAVAELMAWFSSMDGEGSLPISPGPPLLGLRRGQFHLSKAQQGALPSEL